jgi:hypothetical protein
MVEIEFVVVADASQREKTRRSFPADSETILTKLIDLRCDRKAWLAHTSLRIELRLAVFTPSDYILCADPVVDWIKHLKIVWFLCQNVHMDAASEYLVLTNRIATGL